MPLDRPGYFAIGEDAGELENLCELECLKKRPERFERLEGLVT